MVVAALSTFFIEIDALDENLFLVSQPVVPFTNRKAPAYHEMLLRYRDDDGEIHTPDGLLDSSTTDHMLRQVDRWVFRRTIAWLAENPDISASVNVTAASLHFPKMVDELRVVLHDLDVEPGRLMLEIPEEFVRDDPETFGRVAAEAAGIGLRIAIDGLGGDWDVLQTIRDVGVDAIKICLLYTSDAADE